MSHYNDVRAINDGDFVQNLQERHLRVQVHTLVDLVKADQSDAAVFGVAGILHSIHNRLVHVRRQFIFKSYRGSL